jgi:hypothetical protein
MGLDRRLSEILDVEIPTPGATQTQELVVPDVSASANNVAEQDAKDARNNIRLLIAQGSNALTDLLLVARDGKHPRAYEVVAGLLKTLAELNADLLGIHEKEQRLGGPDTQESADGDIHIEQAVFVGSTTDLQELIKQKRKERREQQVIPMEPPETSPSGVVSRKEHDATE